MRPIWFVAVLGVAACGDDRAREVVDRRPVGIERVRKHVDAATRSDPPSLAEGLTQAHQGDSPATVARLRDVRTEILVSLLTGAEGRLRRDVVYELVRRGPPPASLAPLVELVTDDEAGLAASHALASLRRRSLPELRRRLSTLEPGGEDEDLEAALESAIDEIEWLYPPPPVIDTREPHSAGPPPRPTVDDVRSMLREHAGNPGDRRTAAIIAGQLGPPARVVVPEIAAELGREDAEGLPDIAKALRLLGAEREALLVIRARMANAGLEELRRSMEALAELGPIAADDIVVRAPELLADGGEFGRTHTFDAMRSAEVDPAPFRTAILVSLNEGRWDCRAAARLVGAHPEFARAMQDDLVAALPNASPEGQDDLARALIVTGGLPAIAAKHLLDTCEPYELRNVLAAIGPESASPGDELALRLWTLVLSGDRRLHIEAAFAALERAQAIDARDTSRLLRAIEHVSLGAGALADVCRHSQIALPGLVQLLEDRHDVTWPIAMVGPGAEAALPRLVLEARDQDGGAAFAIGSIGVAGAAPLRVALEGQHPVLRRVVLESVIGGVRDTAEGRTDADLDAACRAYLELLVDVAPERLATHLELLSTYSDSDVRWAADRLR